MVDRDIELAATNAKATGLWGDGETLWVSDNGGRRVYAYAAADGARMADREFGGRVPAIVVGGRLAPWGLWSDGDAYYVVSWAGTRSDPTAYAYRDGARAPQADGRTLWVSEYQRNAKLYAYPRPTVSSNASLMLLRVSDADPEAAGHQMDLAMGSTMIGLTVTAAVGTTTRTYGVTVARAADGSADATLSSLSLSGIDIGTIEADTTSYGADVAHTVSSTVVTATPGDAGAVVDNAVSSSLVTATPNDASAAVVVADRGTTGRPRAAALAAGENTIEITVAVVPAAVRATRCLQRASRVAARFMRHEWRPGSRMPARTAPHRRCADAPTACGRPRPAAPRRPQWNGNVERANRSVRARAGATRATVRQ